MKKCGTKKVKMKMFVFVWARIKDLPDGLTRRKDLAGKVAAKVGDPPFAIIVNEAGDATAPTQSEEYVQEVDLDQRNNVRKTLLESGNLPSVTSLPSAS